MGLWDGLGEHCSWLGETKTESRLHKTRKKKPMQEKIETKKGGGAFVLLPPPLLFISS